MFYQTPLTTLPVALGYYKFNKLNGSTAEVEFKEHLTSDLKTVCIIDVYPLFDLRSSRPPVKSLFRKVIRITNVVLKSSGEVDYCDWHVLDRFEIERLKKEELAPEPVTIDFASLSPQEQMNLYFKVKADPSNVLPDDSEDETYEDDFEDDAENNLSK